MSRYSIPELKSLVDSIGIRKSAKRFNRSISTIRNWLRKGLPKKLVKPVINAWKRSDRSRKSYITRKKHKAAGVKLISTFADIDKFIGAKIGHTAERWVDRKRYWEDTKRQEIPPIDKMYQGIDDGRIFYIDKEGVTWRAYTVEGKLFWTQSTYLDGYDTADDFEAAYESLKGFAVVINF